MIFFWIIICPLVGGLIGHTHNNASGGILMGLLLGSVGWLIVALLDDREPCPECKGRVPDGAKRCPHCGAVFAIPAGYELKKPTRVRSRVEQHNPWKESHPGPLS